MLKILFILFFLVGCSGKNHSVGKYPANIKDGLFYCEVTKGLSIERETLALCKEEIECRKICDAARKAYRE